MFPATRNIERVHQDEGLFQRIIIILQLRGRHTRLESDIENFPV
jgi:hypothetical protein